jgi:hypothetical protein
LSIITSSPLFRIIVYPVVQKAEEPVRLTSKTIMVQIVDEESFASLECFAQSKGRNLEEGWVKMDPILSDPAVPILKSRCVPHAPSASLDLLWTLRIVPTAHGETQSQL